MKRLNTYLMGGLFSLALATASHADPNNPTYVRITGSTAYRGATHTAITHIFATGFTYGYVGTSLSGASQAMFKGTVGGNDVVIETSWTGSVGGVQTVSNGLNVNFLPTSTTSSLTTGGASGLTAGTDAQVPDVAMSDTYQNATPFTATTLTDQKVGIVPFKWVASNGAPTGLTNITPQQAQVLFSNGSLALSLFTGAAADETSKVFAIGRDPDSGTRLTAFAETGVGVASTVVQYQPVLDSSDPSKVASQNFWPVSTVNGITYPLGDGGFTSGGNLATQMTKTTAALSGCYVTYLSTGDAGTAITGGAKELAFNGVTYSLTALQEGLYTFWSYEHLMYKTTLAGVQKTTADTLAAQLLSTDATVRISTMRVERDQDGGQVKPSF